MGLKADAQNAWTLERLSNISLSTFSVISIDLYLIILCAVVCSVYTIHLEEMESEGAWIT